ncbi:hypothetical protein [Nonomuraea sediminis]|uniref:hypothetical protein n=1 Tax=Nonomuraea sediminis TaxID=2835864 RepID=UPI001BDC9E11|nr:hypothetical protein [Nonomuraea sediminis]
MAGGINVSYQDLHDARDELIRIGQSLHGHVSAFEQLDPWGELDTLVGSLYRSVTQDALDTYASRAATMRDDGLRVGRMSTTHRDADDASAI